MFLLNWFIASCEGASERDCTAFKCAAQSMQRRLGKHIDQATQRFTGRASGLQRTSGATIPNFWLSSDCIGPCQFEDSVSGWVSINVLCAGLRGSQASRSHKQFIKMQKEWQQCIRQMQMQLDFRPVLFLSHPLHSCKLVIVDCTAIAYKLVGGEGESVWFKHEWK